MQYFHFSFSEPKYKHYLYTWCQQGCPQEFFYFYIFFLMQKTGSGKVSVLQYSSIVPVTGMCSCCASSFSQFSLQSLLSKWGIGIWISHTLSLWNNKIWGGKRGKRVGEGEFEMLHQHMCCNWKEIFFNLNSS